MKHLSASHNIVVFTVCPSQFGFAMTRRRAYTIAVAKCLVDKHFGFASPTTLLGARPVAQGAMYFDTDKDIVHAIFDQRARRPHR